MAELVPRTPAQRRAYRDDHLALQFSRLQRAADNARQIMGEGRWGERDMSFYTHPAFDPLERVYADASASGLTFHDWIKQQRAQGRRPIHEVTQALGGPEQAMQYGPATELLGNMRDLVRMGEGKQRGLYRKGGGQRFVVKDALGRQRPAPKREAPKRGPRQRQQPEKRDRGKLRNLRPQRNNKRRG